MAIMTTASAVITVFFGLPHAGGDFFTIEDPVKGALDTGSGLAGDVGTRIESDTFSVSVKRGRSRELDKFDPGTAIIALRNFDRAYDPANAAGAFFGELVPGKKMTIEIHGQVIYTGTVDDIHNDWSEDGDAAAVFTAIDGLGRLGRKEFDEWTTTAGQTAGERLDDVLNRAEVAGGINRDFDQGVSILQGDLVSWGANVLSYAQLVSDSDMGRFFATKHDTLTFRDRHSLFSATPTATFGTGGIPIATITTANTSAQLFNRVSVDRENGERQTVVDTTAGTDNDIRSLMIPGIIVDSDDQSLNMAEFLLNVYKTPVDRITSITVKVHALTPSDRGLVSSLDLGAVVRAVWTPRGVGAPIDQLLIVEGIEHSIPRFGWHVATLRTSLLTQQNVFIIEDPVFGALDTGGVLAF